MAADRTRRLTVAGIGLLLTLALGLTGLVLLREPRGEAGQPTAAVAPVPSDRTKVVLLGDAEVVGSPVLPAESTFAARGSRALGWDYALVGAAGSGYEQGQPPLRGFVPQVAALAPQVVVVQGGLADVGSSAADVRSGAGQLLAGLRRALPQARVLVIGPFLRTGLSEQQATALRDAVKAASSDAAVAFVDPVAQGWLSLPGLLAPDGVHLSDAGAQHYAELFAQDVQALGF